MIIRQEVPADYRAVEQLTREAFWNHYGPGCDEHYLVHIMRDKPEFEPELALVAEENGEIIGNIMYTRAAVIDDHGASREVLSFGPISVLPAYQRKGVGKALMDASFLIAREMGFGGVVIYGHPKNYTSRGFQNGKQFGIHRGDGKYPAALLARELYPAGLAGVSGGFQEAGFFHMNPEEVAAFDGGFPPKEKLEGLPSQLEFQEIAGKLEEG